MKKSLFVTLLVLVIIAMPLGIELLAQCPMCKIAAESNLENGGSAGKGLNTGILYMFFMPYIIVAILGFLWYKNRKTLIEIDPSLN